MLQGRLQSKDWNHPMIETMRRLVYGRVGGVRLDVLDPQEQGLKAHRLTFPIQDFPLALSDALACYAPLGWQ